MPNFFAVPFTLPIRFIQRKLTFSLKVPRKNKEKKKTKFYFFSVFNRFKRIDICAFDTIRLDQNRTASNQMRFTLGSDAAADIPKWYSFLCQPNNLCFSLWFVSFSWKFLFISFKHFFTLQSVWTDRVFFSTQFFRVFFFQLYDETLSILHANNFIEMNASQTSHESFNAYEYGNIELFEIKCVFLLFFLFPQ